MYINNFNIFHHNRLVTFNKKIGYINRNHQQIKKYDNNFFWV